MLLQGAKMRSPVFNDLRGHIAKMGQGPFSALLIPSLRSH